MSGTVERSWLRVSITGGKMVIDLSRWSLYRSMRWHVSSSGYAVNRSAGKPKQTVRFHRLVAGTPDGMATDHLNHDRLDNRRLNLRVCTQESNNRNIAGRGYCWDASKQKWIVRYRNQFFGRYETEAEAERVYQLARSGVTYSPRRRKNRHLPVGVFKNKTNRGYQAKVQVNGRRVYLGTFETIEAAAKAYNEMKKGISQ